MPRMKERHRLNQACTSGTILQVLNRTSSHNIMLSNQASVCSVALPWRGGVLVYPVCWRRLPDMLHYHKAEGNSSHGGGF